MPQYRRIGSDFDFSTSFDQPPSPEHWELVEDKPTKAKAPATPVTEQDEPAEPKES